MTQKNTKKPFHPKCTCTRQVKGVKRLDEPLHGTTLFRMKLHAHFE